MGELFSKAFVVKFLKFGVVGFTGLFVDFGITYLTKEKLRIPKFVANGIGFSAAATSNYFLNRVWTFQSTNPEMMVEFTEFFIIAMVGLAINTLILWLLVEYTRLNFYVAKVFAIGFVTIWNFLANAFITFSPEHMAMLW